MNTETIITIEQAAYLGNTYPFEQSIISLNDQIMWTRVIRNWSQRNGAAINEAIHFLMRAEPAVRIQIVQMLDSRMGEPETAWKIDECIQISYPTYEELKTLQMSSNLSEMEAFVARNTWRFLAAKLVNLDPSRSTIIDCIHVRDSLDSILEMTDRQRVSHLQELSRTHQMTQYEMRFNLVLLLGRLQQIEQGLPREELSNEESTPDGGMITGPSSDGEIAESSSDGETEESSSDGEIAESSSDEEMSESCLRCGKLHNL